MGFLYDFSPTRDGYFIVLYRRATERRCTGSSIASGAYASTYIAIPYARFEMLRCVGFGLATWRWGQCQ
jgi:hypothetical protein